MPPEPKRRKLRKGTQSCWECKRRKIRCTFVTPTESICDGCKSRQVKCISQEFHDEAEATKTKTDRLDRVEALVEQLTKRASTDIPSSQLPRAQDARAKAWCSAGSNASVTPENLNGSIFGTRASLGLNMRAGSSYDDLCDTLVAAWPSEHDLALMTSVTVGVSVLFHGVLPPPGSHPGLIARKLLMLGSFLQGVPTGAGKDLDKLGTKYRQVMSRAIETPSRLVTSNDKLVDSIEGIECIMIESMYHNNAGNLRRAWITNRRAMAIAQVMGLHLRDPPLTKFLDIETRNRVEPEHMWFRLVISDRYLSLMLGLPQSYLENPFATSKLLEGCVPLDRIERIEAIVGGLILQRNREDLHNLESTHKIDKLLQDAAGSMPAQWWLTPDVSSIAGSEANAFSETIRIMNQFTHYHLLAQLHLPYMLQPFTDRRYDYSKITAVNASREILSRFVFFRGLDTVPAYCRGVDFIAFIASTILCLAHIDSCRQYRASMSNCATDFRFFSHKRLSDRGLMERTLLSVEKTAEVNNDAICCKIASILQPLLTIEAAATDDCSFKASVSPELAEQEFPCRGNAKDANGSLSVQIPYFGTVKIERDGMLRYAGAEHTSFHESARLDSSSNESHSSKRRFFEPNSPPSREGQPPRKGPSSSVTCQDGTRTGVQPLNADRNAVSPHLDSTGPAEGSQSTTINEEFSHVGENLLDEEDMLIPGLAADIDDWTLQGVDMALFDSLIRGAGDSSLTR